MSNIEINFDTNLSPELLSVIEKRESNKMKLLKLAAKLGGDGKFHNSLETTTKNFITLRNLIKEAT